MNELLFKGGIHLMKFVLSSKYTLRNFASYISITL